jgi:uncharacterized protein
MGSRAATQREMRTVADIVRFVEGHSHIARLLDAVDSIPLPDCWIGAGLIRNAIWDELHGSCSGATPDADVDVVYFDAADTRGPRDATIEARLIERAPETKWSVHNQARMHLRNGDSPYLDLEDAMRHWPETATAIAARRREARVELLAPFGIADLVDLIVRPTPSFALKIDAYRVRILAKNWKARWPRLTIVGI